eukprot:2924643-Amphidinium_carterae.1
MGISEANSAMYVMELEGLLYGEFQLLASEIVDYLPTNTLKPSQGLPLGFMKLLPVTQGSLYPKFVELWNMLTPDDIYGSEATARYMLDQMRVLPADASAPMLTEAEFADASTMDAMIPYLFDAGYTFVNAINNMLNNGTAPTAILGKPLLDEVKRTNFEGISGIVTFNEDGDRSAEYELKNLQSMARRLTSTNSTSTALEYVVIAVFNAETNTIRLAEREDGDETRVIWVGGVESSESVPQN